MLGLSIEITYPRLKVRSRCEWPSWFDPKNVFRPICGAAVPLNQWYRSFISSLVGPRDTDSRR